MKNLTLTILSLLYIFSPVSFAFSDGVKDLSRYTPPKQFENIHVIPLSTGKHSSEYVIFIKEAVKAHYHQTHTELVYIIEGTGLFQLGETIKKVMPGDFIRIEEGQMHSVKVTSKQPLKVLSVQTPEFHGKDRVFVIK